MKKKPKKTAGRKRAAKKPVFENAENPLLRVEPREPASNQKEVWMTTGGRFHSFHPDQNKS